MFTRKLEVPKWMGWTGWVKGQNEQFFRAGQNRLVQIRLTRNPFFNLFFELKIINVQNMII